MQKLSILIVLIAAMISVTAQNSLPDDYLSKEFHAGRLGDRERRKAAAAGSVRSGPSTAAAGALRTFAAPVRTAAPYVAFVYF